MSALKKNAKRLGTLFLTATVIGSNVDWTSVKVESKYDRIDDKIVEVSPDVVTQPISSLDDEDLLSNDEFSRVIWNSFFMVHLHIL